MAEMATLGEQGLRSARGRSALHTVTLEHVLYASIFAIGVAVRFWGLSRLPLNTLEAINSWAAWQRAMPDVVGPAVEVSSPLFSHMQTLLFWLGANGDAAARVVSAAAGSLLVLVPWLLRSVLGRVTALALSFLLALDPWLVAFSRYADGAMLSALLAILLLALATACCLEETTQPVRGFPGSRKRYSSLIALAGGLYLASGHMAWSFLPVLFVFAALNFDALRRGMPLGRGTALWFIVGFLAGATGWLVSPNGIGLFSASLTTWIDTVVAGDAPGVASRAAATQPIWWPLIVLLSDQPFVALFGLGGLVHMSLRRKLGATLPLHWQTLLWFWLAWGVVLCLLPGRSEYSLLVLIMPLLFGAAYATGHLIAIAPLGPAWRETLGVVSTLLLLLASAGFWAAALISSPALDMLMLQALLLILLLSASILVFFGVWSSWNQALWAGLVVLGMALLLTSLGATWRVNHWTDLDSRGGLFAEHGDGGLRRLVADIETLSAQRVGDPHEMTVIIDEASLDQPTTISALDPNAATVAAGTDDSLNVLLAWHLRNMRRLQWGASSDATSINDVQPLVISGPTREGPPTLIAGKDYMGSTYRVRSIGTHGAEWRFSEGTAGIEASQQHLRSVLERTWSERLQPWLRWSLYRKGDAQAEHESVILWASRPE